ncbi:MAG: TonB-dependent receptor [Deltaproteobacteria bacterium]|nr:TonB-dependent receptor [Deltaproteobacteria bacterium]
MKKNFTAFIMIVLGIAFFSGEIPYVLAQSTFEEFTLEEITVTAQKREENLQKVAVTVETISGDELTEMGLTNLSDALAGISGALVQKIGHEMNVTIRGMVNNNPPGSSVNMVGVAIDGSYSNNFGMGQSGFYDMQRIEVLSGPQSTLYSRNSSGGVVNMVSNNPSAEGFEGSGSVEMGNYHLLNTQGMINVPLSDKVAFRAAFNAQSHEGYVSNGTQDDDTKSARLKLGYAPTDKLSMVLTYEYSKSGGIGSGAGVDPFESEDDVDNPWTSSLDKDLFSNDRMNQRAYLNLNWSTPIGDVTFLPSYAKFVESNNTHSELQVGPDGLPAAGGPPGMATNNITIGYRTEPRDGSQKETAIELRMASPSDFFMKWLVGLYYYNQNWHDGRSSEDTFIEYEGNPIKFSGSQSWSLRKNPSKAVFGNITYPVTDAFRVTAGGRYTTDKEKGTGWSSDRGTNAPSEYETSHGDYKLGAEYDLGSNAMLWVDYSTGYKQNFGGSPAQTLKAYQLGEKSRFLDQKLQLNATAFYYDYQNFQIQMSDRIIVGATEYMADARGEAAFFGLDLSANYIITSRDRLNLSISYLDSTISNATIQYKSFSGDILPEYTTTMDSGLPELNNAPKYSITASYQHRFDLSGGGSLLARIDPRYKAKSILQFQPSGLEGFDTEKLNTEPAHLMADVSLNYSNASGNWSLNSYVKNVTNHAEKTGFYMGINYMQIGNPRTYGAVLSVKF